jgi:hypothetical protein
VLSKKGNGRASSRRDVARARAAGPRRPRPRRPRLPPPETLLPHAHAPRLRESPRRRATYAPSAPQTAGPTAASPPYARPPRTGTTAASSSSPRRHPQAEPRLFKRRPSPSLCAAELQAAIAAAGTQQRRSLSPPANHSTSFPRPSAPPGVMCCPAKHRPRCFPRATAATAAGRRRSPSPAALRPNSDHPSIPGEPTFDPEPFPGQERRRISGEPAASPAKDPIAGLKILVGCFL